MIYISPTGSFNNPSKTAVNDGNELVKVQIENSLAIGWKSCDILLVTNFAYQYREIKAMALKDIEFFWPYPKASKINAIIKLFQNRLISENELYWFHDLDAFQSMSFAETEPTLESADLGLTAYDAYNLPPLSIENKKWNTGSFFFRSSARDIFYHIQQIMYEHEAQEEKTLTILTNKYINVRNRVKKLNHTYNFVAPAAYYYGNNYEPEQPIRVIHYHPKGTLPKSRENIKLIPEELEKIFRFHGVI